MRSCRARLRPICSANVSFLIALAFRRPFLSARPLRFASPVCFVMLVGSYVYVPCGVWGFPWGEGREVDSEVRCDMWRGMETGSSYVEEGFFYCGRYKYPNSDEVALSGYDPEATALTGVGLQSGRASIPRQGFSFHF